MFTFINSILDIGISQVLFVITDSHYLLISRILNHLSKVHRGIKNDDICCLLLQLNSPTDLLSWCLISGCYTLREKLNCLWDT